MDRQEASHGEYDFEQVTRREIQASGPARFLTRRDFLKLAGTTGAAVLVLGGSSPFSAAARGDGAMPKIDEALAPPIAIDFQVDERLKTKRELTAVTFNNNFSNPNKLLHDAWWQTAHAAWERTNGNKIPHDEYMGMAQQAATTGDHDPLMFSVGGTDKGKSPYNMSTFFIDPLKGTRVLVVDNGVYGGQFLGMQLDEVRAGYAPDDKHGQRIDTETTHKHFGFAKDGDGQLVMLFNWDPSELSRATKSAQLTEGFTEALSLLAYRNPGIHNMSYLPGTVEDKMAFFRQKSGLYKPLFSLDLQGDRIGLLTAPEFLK